MEISANFAFLKQEFPHAAESASYAERHVYGDPRASCFHARHALERLGQACLQGGQDLEAHPRSRNWTPTSASPPSLRLCPRSCGRRRSTSGTRATWRCTATRTPAPELALNVVRELAHVLYWAGRTYLRKGAESLRGKSFDEYLDPHT